MMVILMGGGNADNADDDGWSVGHWLIIKERGCSGQRRRCRVVSPGWSKSFQAVGLWCALQLHHIIIYVLYSNNEMCNNIWLIVPNGYTSTAATLYSFTGYALQQ